MRSSRTHIIAVLKFAKEPPRIVLKIDLLGGGRSIAYIFLNGLYALGIICAPWPGSVPVHLHEIRRLVPNRERACAVSPTKTYLMASLCSLIRIHIHTHTQRDSPKGRGAHSFSSLLAQSHYFTPISLVRGQKLLFRGLIHETLITRRYPKSCLSFPCDRTSALPCIWSAQIFGPNLRAGAWKCF